MGAIVSSNMEELKRILRKNPDVDVCWKNYKGQAPLNFACENGHDAIVPILLAHPAIDVNLKTSTYYGETPSSLLVGRDTTPVFVCCWGIKGSR